MDNNTKDTLDIALFMFVALLLVFVGGYCIGEMSSCQERIDRRELTSDCLKMGRPNCEKLMEGE